MSSHSSNIVETRPFDLSKWKPLPAILIVLGIVGCAAGAFINTKQFAYSWLLAFMFFLSICVGGFFLVLVHHLFDASWSVPIRRINEHIACLFPVLAVMFIPIAILAPKIPIYPWMTSNPLTDEALRAKLPLFTISAFYIVAAFNFIAWTFLSFRLRHWSLEQDRTGDPICTRKMRVLAAFGIFFFAITVTLAAIMWMKALEHQWFSTMYGVYYFAGSTWLTLSTVYVIAMILKRQGPLAHVMQDKQFYFTGSLLFAFTVFYAYVTFAQYFIIWNANMPEETFWYLQREKGNWYDFGLIIIFGHFFLPFLTLLRIDVKLKFEIMVPLAVFAWLMHYTDMAFNIMPVLHPDGYDPRWLWLDFSCFALIGGVMATVWLKYYAAHPAYPLRDPRLAEGLDVYVTPISVAEVDPTVSLKK